MDFAEHIINFYQNLKIPKGKLPSNIEWINSVAKADVQESIKIFYSKFYADHEPRTLLTGINPGRLGAGITGIGFTDPINLELHCGIPNNFDKKNELSSRFIFDVVQAAGGVDAFFSKVYITSMCPLGFVKEGINLNYYDDKELIAKVWPFMQTEFKKQMKFPVKTKTGYSIGKGLNFKYLQKINKELNLFDEVKPLPHPRWVMQYRLKSKNKYIDEYLEVLLG
jgi:hypothetical protein|tara:strand:- start:215 stop:886 length:672 start_codon:yes stop_codon:yes gene_type:complete